MQTTAQAWLVLSITHSAVTLGLIVALQTLPVLLLGAYGGVVADRVDKRRMMIALQSMMGLQALILGTLTLTHRLQIWEIAVLAVALGCNNAFENPSRQAFILEMVGGKSLRNAVSLNSVMVNVARAVGPAVAGLLIVAVGMMGERVPGSGSHALIHYDQVRVPAESLLGGEGQAFVIAQTRLGGGRVHHAMRTVGMASKSLDMLCERAVSRRTRDGLLAGKQSVRDYVADSYIQLTQFRLLVLYVAWCIDQGHDPRAVRRDIAAIKVLTPQVLHDITQRAIQVHGALGVSDEMPLGGLWMTAPVMGLVDGPTEVHRTTVARQVLKGYTPVEGLWPSQHLPGRVAAARAKFAAHPDALASAAVGWSAEDLAADLEHEVGNQ